MRFLEDAELLLPVRERQAEPLKIRVSGENQFLDLGDFHAASVYSRGDRRPVLRDLLKPAAVVG